MERNKRQNAAEQFTKLKKQQNAAKRRKRGGGLRERESEKMLREEGDFSLRKRQRRATA